MKTTKRIEGEDNLSELFNKYQNLLFDIEITFSPWRFSMREYERNKIFEAAVIRRSEEFTFKLIILTNSLKSIRNNIISASGLIQKYLNEYNGDWQYFASLNRVELIREFGGEDEDFNPDGSIVFKQEEESLKDYTVYHELTRYIEHSGNSDRGEFIGTSGPGDFEDLSKIAANKNDFNILSFFRQQGKDIPMYVKGEDGEMKPLSTIERLEKEGFEDLQNAGIVELFNLVLLDCEELSKFFQTINPLSNSKEQYTELLNRLQRILNLDYKLN